MKLLSNLTDRVLGNRLVLPLHLAADLLPPGVVLRQGRVLPALGGFFARMGGPAAAVTLGHTIVVHPDVRLTQQLLTHELAHVRQWEEDSLFPVRYTLETLRHGYRQNRYERQARNEEQA
jgi:hypothetical protein